MKQKLTQQEQVRRDKMKDLMDMGIDPFGHAFKRDAKCGEIVAKYDGFSKEELEEKEVHVTIAGRIMRKRRQGKAGFMNVQDVSGDIQIYCRKDVLGEEQYEIFKKNDIGDIVGIEGLVMKTDHGQLSIRAMQYTHLSKALRPLPEKFHGLTDTEERFRRRYVDLIMNPEAKKVALTRPKIIRAVQEYLDGQGLMEVETPVLQPILGGAAARPFVTHHNALNKDFYLRIATELPLKRLIVGGLEGVYEIGRLFRNEGMDATHNPEFTTVEAYVAYSDLHGMMDLIEGLSNDEVALDYIKNVVHADGIITTKSSFIQYGKKIGLYTIHRYFVLDSMALQNIIKQAKNAVQPDAIEILPGVLQPKIVRYITKHSPVPVMCGGLVTVKEDVIHCLQSGAIAVSTTRKDLWDL